MGLGAAARLRCLHAVAGPAMRCIESVATEAPLLRVAYGDAVPHSSPCLFASVLQPLACLLGTNQPRLFEGFRPHRDCFCVGLKLLSA